MIQWTRNNISIHHIIASFGLVDQLIGITLRFADSDMTRTTRRIRSQFIEFALKWLLCRNTHNMYSRQYINWRSSQFDSVINCHWIELPYTGAYQTRLCILNALVQRVSMYQCCLPSMDVTWTVRIAGTLCNHVHVFFKSVWTTYLIRVVKLK